MITTWQIYPNGDSWQVAEIESFILKTSVTTVYERIELEDLIENCIANMHREKARTGEKANSSNQY